MPTKSPPKPATLPEPTDQQYKTFLKWLALPQEQKKSMKLPITLPDYKQAFKVNIDAFYSKDSFADDVVEATVKWAKQQTPEMVQILYERYKDRKSPADFNAFIEFINNINKKDKNNLTQYNIFNINDDQYKQIIAREARVILEGNSVLPEASGSEQAA